MLFLCGRAGAATLSAQPCMLPAGALRRSAVLRPLRSAVVGCATRSSSSRAASAGRGARVQQPPVTLSAACGFSRSSRAPNLQVRCAAFDKARHPKASLSRLAAAPGFRRYRLSRCVAVRGFKMRLCLAFALSRRPPSVATAQPHPLQPPPLQRPSHPLA